MKPVRALARLSLLPLILPLAACGGSDGGSGGGGIVSTPPPPTYTKLADLTGNQTFQSAGVHFVLQAGTPQKTETEAFGSGVKITQTTTDLYTLIFPDGRTSTLTPSSNPPSDPGLFPISGNPSQTSQAFQLTVPSINGVKLSYTALGVWQDVLGSLREEELAIFGVPTVASDVPHNGSASYTSAVGGFAAIATEGQGGFLGSGIIFYNQQQLSTQSSATFSADFGAGTVATNLHLIGTSADLGSFSGSGTITANSPGFTGTFANTTASGFSGAFFGPQASEMAYGWYLSTASMTAIGTAWGKKN